MPGPAAARATADPDRSGGGVAGARDRAMAPAVAPAADPAAVSAHTPAPPTGAAASSAASASASASDLAARLATGHLPEPAAQAALPGVPGLAATRAAVRHLAPRLGLDPDSVPLHVAAAEGGPLGRARALASADGIHLRPSELAAPDPALLVHELAHIAQHRNRTVRPSSIPDHASSPAGRADRALAESQLRQLRGNRPSAAAPADPATVAALIAVVLETVQRPALLFPPPSPDVTAAESEAAALSQALRGNSPLWHPHTRLPDGHLARDAGATGIAPAPTPAPAPATADLWTTLRGLVIHTRAGELTRIRGVFADFWSVDEDRRSAILGLLDALPFVVGVALLQLLPPEQRRRLACLRPEDHEQHPESAVAFLAALDPADIRALGPALTRGHGAALSGLSAARLDPETLRHGANPHAEPIALVAFQKFVRGVADANLLELLDTEKREEFRGVLGAILPAEGIENRALEAALVEERRLGYVRTDSFGADGSPATTPWGDLVSRITERLAHPDATQAHAALDLLADLIGSVTAESTAATTAGSATSAGSMPPDPASPGPQPATTTVSPAPAPVPGAAGTGNAPVRPGERLRAVVTELDRLGLVDKILDHVPNADHDFDDHSNAHYRTALAAILAARSPALNLAKIEYLLSYRLIFHWWISDDDAQYAYLLVRSLPLAAQDEWRLREDAKWFHRLEDNLPDWMILNGVYTGVGSEYVTGAQTTVDPAAVTALVAAVWRDWRAQRSAVRARETLERLAPDVPMPTTVAPPAGTPAAAEREARIAARELRVQAVRRLDTLNLFDQVFDHLDDAYIVAEDGRHTIDRLCSLRDPVRMLEQVEGMVNPTMWAISARTAWLTHLMLRSLPAAEQSRWDREHPGQWTKMMLLMTPEMRRSAATGAATGRTGTTVADLRDRISDLELWDGRHTPELRALLLLAHAVDDQHWVYDFSRAHPVQLRAVGPLFAREMGLYDPVDRPTYVPEDIHVPSGLEEVGRYIGMGVRLFLYAAGEVLEMALTLPQNTIDTSVNLEGLQWALGGDVMGAEFTDRDQTVVGGTTREERELRQQTNRIGVRLDPAAGALRLSVPRLRLNRVNVSRPGLSIHTGPIELNRIEIDADFSDRGYHHPTGFELRAGDADVRDLVIARADAMSMAFARFGLDVLQMRAGETGTESMDDHPPRPGTIGIPLIGPLLRAIDNIAMIWGGLPGDYTLVDYAMIPFDESGLPWLFRKLVERGVSSMDHTPAPLSNLYGLASDGVLRPPRSVSARIQDAVHMIKAMQLSVADLTFEGASLGAGIQIASFHLHDLGIGVGLSRPAYLRNLVQSLNRRIPGLTGAARAAAVARRDDALDQLDHLTISEVEIRRLRAKVADGTATPADRTRLDRLVAEQNAVVERRRRARQDPFTAPGSDPLLSQDITRLAPPTDAELRMNELERRDRWHSGALNPAESADLADLNTLLRSDAGGSLDVGGIDIGRVSGAVEAAGAHIGPIRADAHIHSDGLADVLGYQTDAQLAGGFRGRRPVLTSPADLAHAVDVSLEIDQVQVLPNPDGGPVLRFPAGEIPSPEQVRALRDAVPDLPRTRVLRERLDAAVRAREQLAALEASAARPAGYELRVQTLRTRLRRLLGWEVGSLSLGPVTAGLDPQTAALTAHIAGVDARDIRGPSAVIGQASGSVDLGAALGGLTGPTSSLGTMSNQDLVNAISPHFGLDLTFENVVTPSLRADRIALRGLRGTVQLVPNGVRIPDLRVRSIELTGLDLSTPLASIVGRNVTVDGILMDITYATVPDLPDTKRVDVATLDINRITGEHIVYTSRDAHNETRVEVRHGALGAIHGSGLFYQWDGSDRYAAGGDLGVGGVDFRYDMIRTVLAGGARTRVSGGLVGGTVPPVGAPFGAGAAGSTGAAGGPAPVLHAGFVVSADGHQQPLHYTAQLDVHGLSAVDTHIQTPSGSVVIQQLPVGAHLYATEEGVDAQVDLTDIRIGAVDWRSGTSHITSDGGTTLAAVRVAGSYRYGRPAADGNPARPPSLRVDRFVVEGIDAANLRYQDSGGAAPLDVQLGRTGSHPGALHVDNITVQGFSLPVTAGGDFTLPSSLDGTVTGVHLDARVVRGALTASGAIDAQRITIGMSEGGNRIRVRASGVSGDFDVHDPAGPVTHDDPDPMGVGLHGAFGGLDTGDITITPEAFEIEGLNLPDLTLNRIDATALSGFAVRSFGGGEVAVHGVHASVRVDRSTGRINLRTLIVDQVAAQGLEVIMPGRGRVALPGTPATPATLNDIRFGGYGPDGFVVLPAGAPRRTVGTISVGSTIIPRVRAELPGMFVGDVRLATDAIVVALPASAASPPVVTITRPRGGILSAPPFGPASVGASGGTLRLNEFGAEQVVVAGDHILATDPYLDRLEYSDPSLMVQAAHVSAPGLTELFRNGLIGHVPHLVISDATVKYAFAPGPSGPSTTTMTPDAKHLLWQLAHTADIDVPVFIRLHSATVPVLNPGPPPLPVPRLRDVTIEVPMRFRHGIFDAAEFSRFLASTLASVTYHQPTMGSPGSPPAPASAIPDPFDLWPSLPGVDDGLFRWILDTVVHLIPGTAIGPNFQGLDVALGRSRVSTHNPAPIRIDLTGSVDGHVQLSRNAAEGLTAQGIIRMFRPPGVAAPGKLDFGLESLSIDEVALMIYSAGVRVRTGLIQVTGVDHGTLTLENGDPVDLRLHVTSATADDIEWRKY